MINKVCVILSLLITISSTQAAELLYLASGGAIEVKKIDPATGKLSDFQKVEFTKLSKFTFSRSNKFLYAQAALKDNPKQATIITYKVAEDGELTYVNNAPINGGTTELKTDQTDNYIAFADYGGGTATVCKLENGIFKGKEIQKIKLEKKAHAARFSPDNKMLMIPATGPNVVFQLAFDAETGKITKKNAAPSTSQGACQPRHLIFHPEMNIAYSTQERVNPGVGVWKWDPAKGQLKFLQEIMSNKETTGSLTTADLHMSPDNKYLYASLRDKNKKQDAILLYKIKTDGTLQYVNRFPCENIPRSFCLNKTGDFLYVAGQRADMMGVYKINKANGHLSKVTHYKTGKGPIWVETLER